MPKVVDIEQRRQELAAAAAQLIARAGVGAATMRDVAAEAGWTTGALTHYFADKRELLLYTFRSSLAGRHVARGRRRDLSPEDDLLESLEGALPLDDARRRHWMVTIAFCAQAAGDDELSEAQRRRLPRLPDPHRPPGRGVRGTARGGCRRLGSPGRAPHRCGRRYRHAGAVRSRGLAGRAPARAPARDGHPDPASRPGKPPTGRVLAPRHRSERFALVSVPGSPAT